MSLSPSRAPVARTTAKAEKRPDARALLRDVRGLIVQAREGVARAVDSGLALHYWHVGRRIRQDILNEKRAAYGEKIVVSLARQLEKEFGRGYAEKNLRRMVQFSEAFPNREIVVSLIRQLSWTHFIALIPLTQPLQRDFYAEKSSRSWPSSRAWRS